MTEFFVLGQQFDVFFLELFDVLVQFASGRIGSSYGGVFFQHLDARMDFAGQRHDIFGAHSGERAFVVTVQVNQGLECALFAAGKQPVNRTFFVGLQVIFKKAAGKIAADGLDGGFIAPLTQAFRQPREVCFNSLSLGEGCG